MKSKLISDDALKTYFKDGCRIIFGGFMGCGTPDDIVSLIIDSGVRHLTIIGNDTAFPDTGVGRLISAGCVEKVIASHIGTNPMTGKLMIEGKLDVELVPQGTLVERIRCGGAGLGGVITPTGIGTDVEIGKEKININGISYLIELPIRGDVSILHAHRGDGNGNLIYRRAARNFNPVAALASDFVVAQVDHLETESFLDPDSVMTPGAIVDALLSSRSA